MKTLKDLEQLYAELCFKLGNVATLKAGLLREQQKLDKEAEHLADEIRSIQLQAETSKKVEDELNKAKSDKE